jgi:transposase
MLPPPDLSKLTEAEKDALILALWAQVQALTEQIRVLSERLAKLEGRGKGAPKTPDNSSLPPSQGHKANRPDPGQRQGPRQGSLGRPGGGRPLVAHPDQTVIAKAVACPQCQSGLGDEDQVLHACYDKIDLPPVRPVVTRVLRYAGRCPCCGALVLAPVPDGLEDGSPFGVSILAAALYLRFIHAISYKRLVRLFVDLFALEISEGALDGLFRRAKPRFDSEVAAILARLRRARLVCSDETSVRVRGQTCWNWVFQNGEVVIHVIRASRGRGVVTEVMGGHRPQFWVSDLYSAQRGHADDWQVCLAHQLRDLRYAVEDGDTIFAPRMKALLLRAAILARRRFTLKDSTRLTYQSRLDRELTAVLALKPTNRHGQRLRQRYLQIRDNLFLFLAHPEVPPDNNGSERDLRPMATYRKVTGGFRSIWGADLAAAVKSVIGTAGRHGADAYRAILDVLSGKTVCPQG